MPEPPEDTGTGKNEEPKKWTMINYMPEGKVGIKENDAIKQPADSASMLTASEELDGGLSWSYNTLLPKTDKHFTATLKNSRSESIRDGFNHLPETPIAAASNLPKQINGFSDDWNISR